MNNYQDVLDFWFDPKHVEFHFEENEAFDNKFKKTFSLPGKMLKKVC